MSDNRIGKNIKALRTAFKETQSDLGTAIHVEKSTISQYENGKRVPDNNTLLLIAKHYLMTVDDLLHSDLSDFKTPQINYSAFLNSLEIFFPIISSTKSLNNELFKTTTINHYNLYKSFSKLGTHDTLDPSTFSTMKKCLLEYDTAYKEEDTKVEAACNSLSIWYLTMYLYSTISSIVLSQPAFLNDKQFNNQKIDEYLDLLSDSKNKQLFSIIDDHIKSET